MKHLFFAALTFFLLLPNAQAEEDAPPYSPYYTGAFLSAGAFAGAVQTTAHEEAGSPGFLAGVQVQASSPLQILDLQLSYHYQQSDTSVADGRSLTLSQHNFSVLAGLHPFFIVHLESSPLYYILGGFHILAGTDMEWATAELPGKTQSEFDPGIQLGLGLDIPLDDVDDGGAWWMGIQYRYNRLQMKNLLPRDLNVEQHIFYVRISYRKNGLHVVVPGEWIQLGESS